MTGSALFKTVCESVDVDGREWDQTAVAALDDWLQEQVSGDEVVKVRAFDMELWVVLVDGKMEASLLGFWGTAYCRDWSEFQVWLPKSVELEFYLDTK